MRLNLWWSSRAEDRFEKWIAQHHEERVLAGETTVAGPCPDETFLENLARKSRKIALSDPRVDHAATCPICMSRLLTLRHERRSRQQRLVFATAIAACVIIAAIVTITRYEMGNHSSAPNAAPIAETVNLWDTGAFRGQQPGPLQSVSLPAALVRVRIILPRFSSPGRYVVAVTHDPNGNGVVAEAAATATSSGNQETIVADLDLRPAKAGRYYLSTTHEQDQAAYYYPLEIR
jgi:hypothetical protein